LGCFVLKRRMGENGSGAMKPEGEIRKTIQEIDEMVESCDSVIERLKLRYMRLQIKLARVKAEGKPTGNPPERE
jgi:hypothetical protein